MAESEEERRHDPTRLRLRKAREQGQVARSRDLSAALALVGSLLLLWMAGGTLASQLAELARSGLGEAPALRLDADQACQALRRLMGAFGGKVMPLLAGLVAVAVAAQWVQTGALFVPQRLTPDWGRLHPSAGLRRLLSLESAGVGLQGLLKLAFVLLVSATSLWSQREALAALVRLDVGQIARQLPALVLVMALQMAGALLVLALLDYLFQRWRHLRALRMTDQEIREEWRTQNGDPRVSSRRRERRRQLAATGTRPARAERS